MRALALVVASLLLAGCTTTSVADPPATQGPQDLVEVWRVHASGETDATWLRLGEDATLWSSCGIATGSWRASGTLFVAGMYGSIRPWCHEQAVFPVWLDHAARYRITAPGHAQLLSTGGAILATLTIDGNPPKSGDYADSLTEKPEVSPAMLASFREPAPLGASAAPVTALSGRWIPSDAVPGYESFVEFDDDNTWTGSDGCNGAGGRWRVGPGGLVLITSGASTAIGCDNSSGTQWVSSAFRAGIVGNTLTFYDAAGESLGSLTRG